MQRSADRILTTHAGSLPRPAELDVAFEQRTADEAGYAKILEQAVDDVVKNQQEVVSRACLPFRFRPSCSTYATRRPLHPEAPPDLSGRVPDMEGVVKGWRGVSGSVDEASRGRGQDVTTVITLICAGQQSRCRMTVSRHRGVLRTGDVGRNHIGTHEGSRQSLPAPTATCVRLGPATAASPARREQPCLS